MTPKVSVVMATYNTKQEYLVEAVSSILNQTLADFELVIIDDHTTSYKVQDLVGKLGDDRIRVYRNSINLGLTKSLNIGVKVTKSNIIARMDADDISDKDRLKTQLAFLEKNIMISLVGSDCKIIDNKGNVIRMKKRLSSFEGISFYSFINNPFIHSSTMFYKDCFYDVGAYNKYFVYSQDYDLWCRYISKYRAANISIPLVKWRDDSNGISRIKCGEQIRYADEIVIKHFRRVLPELADVPNFALLSVRHNRYNRNTLCYTDRVIRTMYEKFTCDYSKRWYENYLARTQCFR